MQQQTSRSGILAESPAASARPGLRWPSGRVLWAILFCVLLLLLAVLPPLVSLSRYQRRVTTSMSQVLGRPVHLDRITLNLLPLPSFTLENLVIDEAPEFGAEPLIRANSVNARLRIGSLWRHRVEFSRITFTDPSVNLVHLPDGRWNLAGVLLQASHVDAAPTAQASAGEAPRFPYIEATGARINLKRGQEKTPFSLTEADFALWLPQPRQWKMRIGGKPARTDTNVTNTGIVQIEASLERAGALDEVPLSVDATWGDAPMGAASRLFTGNDAGVRGQLNLSAHVRGQLSSARVQLRAQIDGLHRADFVPEHSLFVDVECTGRALRVFHAVDDLRCSWPVPDGKGAAVAMTGSVPDILRPDSAQLQIGTGNLPAAVLSAWAHVLSVRIPPDTTATGTMSGSMQRSAGSAGRWQGHAAFEDLVLLGSRLGATPMSLGDVNLQTTAATAPRFGVDLEPVPLALGGHEPALLEGSANAEGYSLHLGGMIAIPRLLALAAAAPQFGEGLAAVLPKNRGTGPTRLDLTAHRRWGGEQIWADTLAEQPVEAPVPRPGGHRTAGRRR